MRGGATTAGPEASALSASRSGGVALLVGVAGLGLAAALGTASMDEAVGLPEDPAHVMLVLQTQSRVPAETVRGGGFEVESDTLEGWAARASEGLQLEAEEAAELSAEQRVMRYADERGVGHLVFEMPRDLEAAGIELGSKASDVGQSAWVALGVGDFARDADDEVALSWAPGASDVVRAPGMGAMQALFAQPRLQETRSVLVDKPSLDELRLQERLSIGQATVDRVASLEALAEDILLDVDKRLNEGEVQRVELADAQGQAQRRSGGVVPLAGGGALVVSRVVGLKSMDAVHLDFELGEHLLLDHWTPGASAVRLAELKVSGRPSVVVAQRGDAWVVDTRFDAPKVFGYAPAPRQEGDPEQRSVAAKPSFVDRGSVTGTAPDERGLGEPFRDGRLARIAGDKASQWVRVYAPGVRAPQVELAPLPGVHLSELHWLDENTLVMLAQPKNSPEQGFVLTASLNGEASWRALQVGASPGAKSKAGLDVRGLVLGVAQGDEAAATLALRVGADGGQERVLALPLNAAVLAEARRATVPLDLKTYGVIASGVEGEYLGGPIGDPELGVVRTDNTWLLTWADRIGRGTRVMGRRCTPSDVPGEGWSCETKALSAGAGVHDERPRPLAGGEAVVFASMVPVSVTAKRVTQARWVAWPAPALTPTEP